MLIFFYNTFRKESHFFISVRMSICLSLFKFKIFLKLSNYENKLNSSISNKLSCFKDHSRLKHFSFKSVQCNDFNFVILN